MSDLPIDAADQVAGAYGQPEPYLPVLPETYGLALVLLISRNTSEERSLFFASLPEVQDAVCVPAEAFACSLEPARQPRRGWRGGAVASLRELAGGTLHYSEDRYHPVWVEDDDPLTSPAVAPLRGRLITDLAPHPRAGAAWDKLLHVFHQCKLRDEPRTPAQQLDHHGCLHERPADTEWLHSQVLGRDPQADLLDRLRNDGRRG